MKQSQSKNGLLYLAALTTIFCWNGSVVDSSSKDKRQDTNIYGEVQDHKEIFKAEDISIAEKIDNIRLYQTIDDVQKATDTNADKDSGKNSDKNIKMDMNPTKNWTPLDLRNVSTIEACHPENPTASEITINNRKYIEIKVTFINDNKETYLVESSRMISCLKINKGPDENKASILEKRNISMLHMVKITIKGYKSAQDVSKKRDDDHDNKKAEVSGATEKILDQLEENVKNLPHDDSSQYAKIKSTMLSLLKSLREQLQKMLNMLKN